MTPLRTALLALFLAAAPASLPARAQSPPTSGGFVDGSMFRELIDETKEVVEVNLDGAILQALANSSRDDDEYDHGDRGHDGKRAKGNKDLFAKLTSIHAVIGTVKGPSSEALALVQKTDRRLAASGWQRITRITSPESTISVLTHTAGNKVDGLVALIFDAGDKELVFANLAGEIDVTQLGEIGERFNVPGLGALPGMR